MRGLSIEAGWRWAWPRAWEWVQCSPQRCASARTSDPTDALTDLRHPSSWFPATRAIQRTIIAHLGATNSGKTHAALQALKAASTGVYAGPLRLLACEIADRLNAEGVACDLVTGQEVRRVPNARHASCTVEMAGLYSGGEDSGGGAAIMDAAVLDEVQMLGDRARGWAWTRALLGLPARELHVCGDPGALPLLRRLAHDCGDELRVHTYSRLAPLVISATPVGCLADIQPGDALVAFSRRAVHRLQREVVRRAPWATPSLVYGALPPDARRHQAAAFNSRAAQCDVLVATDVLGMGLNLAISRVVFTRLTKWDGEKVRPLTAAEVRQLAGRAGRFGVGQQANGCVDGSSPPAGIVTCLHGDDLPLLHAAMKEPSIQITKASLLPRLRDLSLYYVRALQARRTVASHDAPPLSLRDVLVRFLAEARLTQHYLLADMRPMLAIAALLAGPPSDHLSVDEQLVFASAPADVSSPAVAAALLRFVAKYVADGAVPVAAAHAHQLPWDQEQAGADEGPITEEELQRMEESHAVLDLYVWLSFRLPLAFRERAAAEVLRAQLAAAITRGLQQLAGWHHRHHYRHHHHQQQQQQQQQQHSRQKQQVQHEDPGALRPSRLASSQQRHEADRDGHQEEQPSDSQGEADEHRPEAGPRMSRYLLKRLAVVRHPRIAARGRRGIALSARR